MMNSNGSFNKWLRTVALSALTLAIFSSVGCSKTFYNEKHWKRIDEVAVEGAFDVDLNKININKSLFELDVTSSDDGIDGDLFIMITDERADANNEPPVRFTGYAANYEGDELSDNTFKITFEDSYDPYVTVVVSGTRGATSSKAIVKFEEYNDNDEVVYSKELGEVEF